jgi:dipeptidyl-peptidase-4
MTAWYRVAYIFGVFALATFFAATAAAQGDKLITYEQAFGGPPPSRSGTSRGVAGVLGSLPEIEGWLDDESYLELRSDEDEKEARLFAVSAADGTAELYRDYPALGGALPEGFNLKKPTDANRDLTRLVVGREGDLYFVQLPDGTVQRLTATRADEKNPTLSPDGRWLAYTRDNDLYAYDLESSIEHQLTADGSESILNGYASWVYYEEILGRRGRYRAFWWSPDSSRLVFLRFDDSTVPTFPIYHADGQHGELELQRYPKAGDANPEVRAAVVAVADGTITWLDFAADADHYLAFPVWFPKSDSVLIQWMNRGQDVLRLYSCDAATGGKTLIHEERQQAWVEFYEDLQMLEGGGGFLFTSDVDGWRHIYLHGADGKLKSRLTSGSWAVRSIETVDEAAGWVYFTGSPGKSWDSQLLRVDLTSKKLETLTPEEGTHRIEISPSGAYFVDTFSSIHHPHRIQLHRGDGSLVRELGDQRIPATDGYAWGRSKLFTIQSADGAYRLPANWVVPRVLEKDRRYPVIVSIYGGPGSASVRNSWPRLRDHYWAQRGVITLRVDHRGSGHFGKTGTALMHGALGRWEMEDYAAAAAWLRTLPFVDADRIAITGGSYGGYVTMMALTKGAEHFNFGVAGASVTDWRLYDSVYTERYMDAPAENPEGYEASAVLTWADRYNGGLLITHGTIDDNVHMQNSIQVVDRLTSDNKLFELMLYPDSRHGVQRQQRAHQSRLIHDFWVRTLLGGEGELAPRLGGRNEPEDDAHPES